MPDDVVLVGYAIAPQHVPCLSCDVQGFAGRISLYHANHLGSCSRGCEKLIYSSINITLYVYSLVLVLQSADLQAGVQSQGYFGHHVGQLFLNQLVGGQRPVELLPLEDVLSRQLEAALGCTQSAPAYAVSRIVQASKGPLR